MAWSDRISWRFWLALSLTLVFVQALGLNWLGRLAICQCGYVKLWHGEVYSGGNSQHVADWFSLAHVVGGMLGYWFFTRVVRVGPVGARLLLTTLVEMMWELAENTPFLMDRYRTYTVSRGYYGDTILNSVGDTLFCLLGFVLARRFSARVVVAWAVAMELLVLYAVRDNATLNTIMLVHPIEAIRKWQLAIGP